MPRALFLESLDGSLSLFTRGLLAGARAAGWRAEVEFLRESDGRPRALAALQRAISAQRPDVIAFLMDAPLAWPELWDAPGLRDAPKASLWFDDFMRSPLTLAGPDTWRRWQLERSVRVFFWDGHWRERWLARVGAPAHPIHLAADPADFQPTAPSEFPELKRRVVFVGTVPSKASLAEEAVALHPLARAELAAVVDELERAPWPLRPYEAWERRQAALEGKRALAIAAWLESPERRAVLHRQLWRWGKRVARLRGLAAVAGAAPLAALSGHRAEAFAREDELRAALPSGADFIFRDTTELPPQRWSGLFRCGRLQLQITDPQSISGGVPFRFFECAACARALLSDTRPELADLAPASAQAFLAADERALASAAADPALASAEPALGAELREEFLQRHTWSRRWRQVAAVCGIVG